MLSFNRAYIRCKNNNSNFQYIGVVLACTVIPVLNPHDNISSL